MAAQHRPLSPHLQVYKQKLTGTLSITHRATGVFLSFTAFLLAAWLLAVAGDGPAFDWFATTAGSWLGKLLMAAIVFALVYHTLNGVRHLLWDIGWGFELPQAYASGWTVVVLTLLVSALLLWLGFAAGGVP